jgi:hypothetical protein
MGGLPHQLPMLMRWEIAPDTLHVVVLEFRRPALSPGARPTGTSVEGEQPEVLSRVGAGRVAWSLTGKSQDPKKRRPCPDSGSSKITCRCRVVNSKQSLEGFEPRYPRYM